MINDNGEHQATRILEETLGERGAVQIVVEHRVHRRIEQRKGTDRGHCRRLIDYADADNVATDRAGRNVIISSGSGDIIETIDKISDRHVGGVVLELDQPEDVGIQPGDRGHELVSLSREFLCGVCAPAELIGERAANRANSVFVDRCEVVEYIERSDANGATDIRRPASRIDARESYGRNRVQLIGAERITEHCRQSIDGVAGSKRVVLTDVRRQRRRVRKGAGIVQLDPAAVVEVLYRHCGRAGHRDIGGIVEWRDRRQIDFAETALVEVAGNIQRVRERDQHPLPALEFVFCSNRQSDRRRRDRVALAADGHVADGVKPRQIEELGDVSLDPHHVAHGNVRAEAQVVHEDAL